MIAASSRAADSLWRAVFDRAAWPGSIVFFGALPVLVLALLFASTIEDGSVAIDFRPFHRAADAIVDGEDPYPEDDARLTASGGPYVYPPPAAIATIPLTAFSLDVAELMVMTSLVLVALAIPLVLGVRDWRCYGLVLLWPPVISAIQTGNVTLWFALAAALAWRLRDRRSAGVAVGLTLAIKFVLWPLVVWLIATRRALDGLLACAVGALLILVSWAAIGFTGFTDYPRLLRRLEDAVGQDAYTINNLMLDLGVSATIAWIAWASVGLALLAAVVAAGRRGDDRSAFILGIGAALALSPLVWLHYFALLLVAVAVARPALGLAWLIPLAMVVAPGSGNPTLLETLTVLCAAALTLALALRSSTKRAGAAGADPLSSRSSDRKSVV